ncbi:PREDICTED: coiled-coil alpha-helical rod protein 1 isoform X3 [Chinchilla lanigera]|uniref:coiled-coil alpha-helical rod protein 1 isoform X3 n=1 Tax=Chinchilla lanigera TaxID=34839 RepID=UPI000698A606|nr:PREDICTED: coiled-coil alpha-helical rod protein 1 isoform X3 [Chinchilla lanigera]
MEGVLEIESECPCMSTCSGDLRWPETESRAFRGADMLPPSGFAGLVPPSHFQARPLPTQPRVAPTWISDVTLLPPLDHQDVSQRHQRPRVTAWERDVCGDWHGPGRRGRSLELAGSQALSQQAELISRQLQELRRLEEEVRGLRETSLQQKMRLEAQATELEALARAERAGQAEAEGLRTALAGAEAVRKKLEEGSQRELEEVQRLHQEQLSSLAQAHQEALASLTSKAKGLEKSLSGLEARRAGEAKELATAQNEAELLRQQLSKTQEDLEAQGALVESLRKYVGEQVPPEGRGQAWEPERQELLDAVQHLQEDRASLRATAELLQVRVQSLVHVLALQEEELTRKASPPGSLEPEFVAKHQSLLSRWREKVFALLVQLKSQELEHGDLVKALRGQVAELQEQVTVQSQEQAILQRSLQDRAVEVEVERVGVKALQTELGRAQEAQRRQQQQTAVVEEQLKLVAGTVSRCQMGFQSTMTKLEQAVARLPGLSNRLSYAARKVHTVQGLMARKLALAQLRLESCPAPTPPANTSESLELQQLREERNRLGAELQLSARLIQQEVGRAREQGEEERQQLSKLAQQLEQELQRTQESLASVGLQLEAARQGQQESTEEAASLRQELSQQQEAYARALQEKVAEVETRLREQLSDAERRLNEARREQAKAGETQISEQSSFPADPTVCAGLSTVVSLRQMQRTAAREKERNQELRRLQDEARKEEGQRLSRRLQELERDKNLMLQRLLAVLPSLVDEGKPVESSSRPPGPPAAALPTRKSGRGDGLLLGASEAPAHACPGEPSRTLPARSLTPCRQGRCRAALRCRPRCLLSRVPLCTAGRPAGPQRGHC